MEFIIPPVFIGLCSLAYLTHRVCPKGTEVGSLTLMVLGIVAITFLFLGPKEYMLTIPEQLQTVLHPWILGLVALSLVCCGISGIVGSLIGRLTSSRKNRA